MPGSDLSVTTDDASRQDACKSATAFNFRLSAGALSTGDEAEISSGLGCRTTSRLIPNVLIGVSLNVEVTPRDQLAPGRMLLRPDWVRWWLRFGFAWLRSEMAF